MLGSREYSVLTRSQVSRKCGHLRVVVDSFDVDGSAQTQKLRLKSQMCWTRLSCSEKWSSVSSEEKAKRPDQTTSTTTFWSIYWKSIRRVSNNFFNTFFKNKFVPTHWKLTINIPLLTQRITDRSRWPPVYVRRLRGSCPAGYIVLSRARKNCTRAKQGSVEVGRLPTTSFS